MNAKMTVKFIFLAIGFSCISFSVINAEAKERVQSSTLSLLPGGFNSYVCNVNISGTNLSDTLFLFVGWSPPSRIGHPTGFEQWINISTENSLMCGSRSPSGRANSPFEEFMKDRISPFTGTTYQVSSYGIGLPFCEHIFKRPNGHSDIGPNRYTLADFDNFADALNGWIQTVVNTEPFGSGFKIIITRFNNDPVQKHTIESMIFGTCEEQ